MPVISSLEIKQLNVIKDEIINVFHKDAAKRLVDKALVFPVKEVSNNLMEVEISEYGRRVLAFYRAVKDGKVKTKQSQCQGCQNPC